MKILNQNIKVISLFVIIMSAISCSKTDDSNDSDNEDNPEATSINEYIQGLVYDSTAMLNVQPIGDQQNDLNLLNQTEYGGWPYLGNEVTCYDKEYSLASNFDKIAILKPTSEMIYPGALVTVSQGLLENAIPNPIEINRKPSNLLIDLPNMGSNGTITIENPVFESNVQEGINNALSWWNSNAYEANYINTDKSTHFVANSYTSKQIGQSLGVHEDWASDEFSELLEDIQTNSDRDVAYMVIKQVFYSVDVNAPTNPSGFFSNDVTLEEVQSKMDDDNPPAYISSVDYGQIIMLRIRNSTDPNTSLDEVLKYVTGVSEVGGVNSDIENILDSSNIDVITIGANAEITMDSFVANNLQQGPGSLSYLFTNQNAVYSTNNPGIPIGFQTRYLKDNSLVKVGYSTEYTTTDCEYSGPSIHQDVTVTNNSFHDTRFKFLYYGQNEEAAGVFESSDYYELNQGDALSIAPPNGAHSVYVYFQYQYGIGGWNNIFITDTDWEYVNYVTVERCYEFTGGNVWGAASEIFPVSCN